jgi:hypothetical protein
MILSVGTGCAGSILRRGQEKGEARNGTTGERFDEPAAAKDPGPLGCALAGAPGVAPAPPVLPANVCAQSALGRCPTSPFTARLTDRRAKSATQPIRTDKIML